MKTVLKFLINNNGIVLSPLSQKKIWVFSELTKQSIKQLPMSNG